MYSDQSPGGLHAQELTSHGNSWALVIDKPILDLLQIDPQSPLEIRTDGRTLIVAPLDTLKRRATFRGAMKKTNRRYNRALRRLAD